MGFEPNRNLDVTPDTACDCESCQQALAARALYFSDLKFLAMASHDADLRHVVGAWGVLPEAIRTAIMALVSTVAVPAEVTALPGAALRPDPDELAWRLASECRAIVQGCLREEEWPDADREFFAVIQAGLESLYSLKAIDCA